MREAKFSIRRERGRPQEWCLEVSAAHSSNGKRQRLYFATREQAQLKQTELRNGKRQHGSNFRTLPPDVVADVERALELMKEFQDATILDAVRSYVERRRRAESSDTVREILEDYLAAKAGKRSARYVGQIRQVQMRLTQQAGDLSVAALDSELIEEILAAESAHTQNSNARIFKAALRHAFSRDRIPADLSAKVRLVEVRSSERTPLTPDEAARLMAACDETTAPAFALRLFAGIRDGELKRLSAADVDVQKGEIYIRDGVAKLRGHDRIIPMSDNLRAWLTAFPPADPLIPEAWDRLWDEVRERAGLKENWHQNCLRHSFAAYWLAKHEKLDSLAVQMGHISGLKTLRKHYYRSVSKADAEQFWQIIPNQDKPPMPPDPQL